MTEEHEGTLKEAPKKEKLFSKDYLLIIGAATSTSFMNYIFGASVALHVMAIGGLQIHTGILITVYSIASLAMRPVAGILSDKIGRVKLLIASAFVCALCCFLYGNAGVILALIVIRGFNGLGFGMHSTCAGAVAADVLPKSRMTEGLGLYGVGSTLAQALAPMIALAIIGDAALGNFRQLFYFSAVLCALGGVADCCITYERKRKKAAQAGAACETYKGPTDDTTPKEPLPKAIFGFEYVVFAPMVVIVFLFMSMSSLVLFLTPFARDLGIENPGVYYLVSSCGIMLSRVFFGRLADKYGNDIVVIPGLIVFLLLLVAVFFAKTLPALLVIAFPIGLAQGALTPTFNSLVFNRCSAARRGTASGAAFASIDIGFAIGAPLYGAVADAWGYASIYLAAAASLGLAVIFYIFVASDRAYNKRLKRKGII